MSSSWNRKMTKMPNSLWRFRLLNQDPLWNHVLRGILAKGWEWRMGFIWESSWKDHPWEPTNENSWNSKSISSKGGLHSIESFITNEAKLANLARRLEALKTKKPSPVNQVSQTKFQLRAVLIVMPWIMCLRSVLCFKLSNTSEPMNAAFSRPNNDPYAPTYNPDWRNHLNFL